MSSSKNSSSLFSRAMVVFLPCVIGIAVVGFFVGINDGAPREDTVLPLQRTGADRTTASASNISSTIPAVAYAQMRRRETGPTSQWKSSLSLIPQPKFDLFAEIKLSEEDKLQSTFTRSERRAFNGAPPVIPHAVENTTDAACYACHGKGMQIEGRVASQMSHEFFANCTQCHAPPPPSPFSNIDASVNNSFVGLPAPVKGERAFDGAPPTIPHSTWMREKCLACHGSKAGWKGLQSTHPWRINCQQCHAPSALLEQALPNQAGFLLGGDVTK